jgi:AraC-like DNA-binding protein
MILRQSDFMCLPLVNLIEFSQLIAVLDGVATSSIVDRALREAGVSRRMIRAVPGFIPYVVEAKVLESVARSLGDPLLGAHLGKAFDYSSYGSYADYVLGAPNLGVGLARGRRALPFLHPGSDVFIRRNGDHILVGYEHGLRSAVGHKHVNDASIFIMTKVFQHYLGQDWRPAWVELPGSEKKALDNLLSSRIVYGANTLAIAVCESALNTKNSRTQSPQEFVTISELPGLMGVSQPRTMEEHVREVLRLQLFAGDMSVESVAHRLIIGPRTLQRRLRTEGTSFRDVKARFVSDRARALLADARLSINDVARALGYRETNSFRHAFREWTGVSPLAYRTQVLDLGYIHSAAVK